MIRAIVSCLLVASSAFADTKAAVEAAKAGEKAFDSGDYTKAVELFTKAIAEHDSNPSFYGNRGNSYSSLGKLDEALKDYDTAIKKAIAFSGDPKDKRLAYFLYNRGYAYDRAGKPKEALAEYVKTIELDPAYPDAHANAAWILAVNSDATIRNAAKAVEYALVEAKRTKMEDPSMLDTLAAAYAANGQFDEARRYQKQAISKLDDAEAKREFTERLRLYEANKPYVEAAK